MDALVSWRTFTDYALPALAIASLCWLAYKAARYGRREKNLPPGPPTSFAVGNLLIMPTKKGHLKLAEWARQYGEIYSLKVAHQTIIVLNGPAAVQSLMEKGNANTEGRPTQWLLNEYWYNKNHILFTDNQTKVANYRRAFASMLNPKTSLKHVDIQEAESCQLLYDLLQNPTSYYAAIKRYTLSNTLAVAYGLRAPRWETKTVQIVYTFQDAVEHLLAVGATPPLDLIPLLRYLPESLAPWKTLVNESKALEAGLSRELLQIVRDRIARDTKNGCFMEDAVERQASFGLSDEMLKIIGTTALQAGADTLACFLLSAVLLLVGEPEVQLKAQAELDKVIGSNRLPTLKDIPDLPYLRGVVKEVERLRPVGPFGIPHRATADQMYAGYLVPKDATIMVNTWAMGHDPALFDEPEKFYPERHFSASDQFDKAKTEKSATSAWGQGRRICPGQYIAKNTIYIVLSRFLWAFNIVKARDPATGQEIEVDNMDYAEGILLCPNEFACEFRVRSAAHEETVKSEWREAIPLLKRYEVGLDPADAAFVEMQRQEASQ